ncbi:prenyltransferase/squalene oxidase repeat-containing protein [Streptosporangium sp. NBC_01756]|uniref:prenyltransferase/squalene oxidase repeat-containing protein n=1 Tax=Streptosporangium sp. NBC_01756 TaxID=2975950 RepID=UPI002DD977D6|nr:prenyltransferase/squalene oxidase repeat-containing protein [Streptosporangium sp. NBC_01756]WSC85487.1 hypothetical protein OIE48_34815 [Streptosporangium sp. NBC_01756]
MSVDDLLTTATAEQRPFEEIDVAAGARELVTGLLAHPWGQVSASPYETGRMVGLAPWLAGHAERLDFLLATQRSDGGWGAPDGYDLVPTLSATEALLAELRREPAGPGRAVLAGAAHRGVGMLRRRSRPDSGPALPDMPAIELIVPSLVSLINGHLEAEGSSERLELPAGMNGVKLSVIRARMASGAEVPQKLLHALEVVGEAADKASGVVPSPIAKTWGSPEATGEAGAPGSPAEAVATIGASPAAGAAWLGTAGESDPADPVRRYLEKVVAGFGGPVPCALPVTVFERGWTLSWLRRAGIPVDVPPELVKSLDDGVGPVGGPAGPGLPPDADTTSVALYALTLLGVAREPDALWAYETDTHFCTWPGEEGASPTVNAHVLDAFGAYLRRDAGAVPRYAEAVDKLSAWLCGCQEAEGNWLDRWHASPYYATACCSLALDEYGGAGSEGAVRRAVRWVLDSQRADGSWGRWEGTAEETAYALQTLLLTGAAGEEGRLEAVERGYRFLLGAVAGRGAPTDAPALWHDKDLYLPAAIVRAAILGALHLAGHALRAPRPDRPGAVIGGHRNSAGELYFTKRTNSHICPMSP